jgi:signal transduction histidine kinase
VEPDARRSGIEVDFRSAASPAIVSGDEDLLKEALLNIVTNAIEAMPNGGSLRLNVDHTGDRCRISVSDTGDGIPPERRDRIFQLYFTTKKNGSGLGLPMAFRTAQLHGGLLDFESSIGEGTIFHLELPALAKGR